MDPSWPILWARRRLKMERLGPCPHLPRAPRRLHHSSNCWNAPNHLRRQRNASTACSAELRRNSSRRSSKGNTRPRQTSSTPTQTQHKRTKTADVRNQYTQKVARGEITVVPRGMDDMVANILVKSLRPEKQKYNWTIRRGCHNNAYLE